MNSRNPKVQVQNIRKLFSAILISWLCTCAALNAQVIWPGDINNNGRVNTVDLLYWGLAFGETGPARPEINTEWEAIPAAPPWALNFSNGLNYVYADCNGDGRVDEDDYDDGIEDNFGLTHGIVQPDGYVDGLPGSAPALRLETDAQVVPFGTTINIDLLLDDSTAPLDNFYGMALQLSYSTDVLGDDDPFEFVFEPESWVRPDNSLVEELFVADDEQGRAEMAITRTNQQSVPVASARIGSFSIVIEDIIVGRAIDTFRLRIDSVLLFNGDHLPAPVARDSVEIIITDDPQLVSATRHNSGQNEGTLQVFPNPARREGLLVSVRPLSEAWLTNSLGQSRPLELRPTGDGRYQFRRPPVPAGVYWISAWSPDGWIGKSIIFLNQ